MGFLITSAKEVMFLPDFVCLFVCLLAKYLKKLRTDLSEIFWECRAWHKLLVIQFLGVIRKESWILDHFVIFVTTALNAA